jgi:rubrerythrin
MPIPKKVAVKTKVSKKESPKDLYQSLCPHCQYSSTVTIKPTTCPVCGWTEISVF